MDSIFDLLLFSDIPLLDLKNELAIELEDNEVKELFIYGYKKREYLNTKDSRYPYYNKRLRKIFLALPIHKKILLLDNPLFFKENEDLFKETLENIPLNKETFSDVHIIVENALLITSDYFIKMRERNCFFTLRFDLYDKETVKKLFLLEDYLDCFILDYSSFKQLEITLTFLDLGTTEEMLMNNFFDVKECYHLLVEEDDELETTVLLLEKSGFLYTLLITNQDKKERDIIISFLERLNSWGIYFI